jgi:hypothetical protein
VNPIRALLAGARHVHDSCAAAPKGSLGPLASTRSRMEMLTIVPWYIIAADLVELDRHVSSRVLDTSDASSIRVKQLRVIP